MEISKELFESIYDMKINRIDVDVYDNIWIDIESNHLSRFDSINNFFFMCKEWAKIQGYTLLSGRYGNSLTDYLCEISNPNIEDSEYYVYAQSEQQAVFDACQWILENKGE